MKTARYILNGDVPELLKPVMVEGKVQDGTGIGFNFAEGETLDDIREQVTSDADIVKASQSAIDISKQRIARSAANGAECEAILKDDSLTADEKREKCRAIIAERLDGYKFGARVTPQASGGKAAQQTVSAIAAAAQNDPDLAAKLAALGVKL